MKSDSILAKGVKLFYLPTVANPPYKRVEFTERRIKHHKKYRKYHLSVVILKSYFRVAFWCPLALLFVSLKRGKSALIVVQNLFW